MTTVSSVGVGNIVTQYQQAVQIVIADGDANNITELVFAGILTPFTVINSTTIQCNLPGGVKEGYNSDLALEAEGVYGECTFNITHPIRVPAVGAQVDNDSLLAGIGNSTGRYAKVTLPSNFDLDVPEINAVNIQTAADNLVSAKYGTAPGATGALTVDVLNNTGAAESYSVTLVAGANDTGIAPILTVYGGSSKQISLGQTFTPSYSAVDDTEGDITDRVVVSGTVNTNAVGDYVLSYSVQDAFGNESTATQTIQVRQNVRYELRLLKSLDQDVRDVTGTYPTGYVFSENGTFGAIRLGPVSLVNGEVVITQDNVVTGSLAALFTGGTTLVGILLLDDANNVAATPTHIPITSVAI